MPMTADKRSAQRRWKLDRAAASAKQRIAALPSDRRARHQPDIDAYLDALRKWEKGVVDCPFPAEPKFLAIPDGA